MKLKQYSSVAIRGLAIATLTLAAVSMFNTSGRPTAPFVKEVASEEPPTATNLAAKKKKVITSITPDPSRVLFLTGTVGPTSTFLANQILELSRKSKAPIHLLINSPGGSVLDGAQVISAMEASQAPVHTVCLQLCASMAAMIFEYGDERLAVDRSFIMFHPASGGAQGEVDKMVSRLNSVQRYIAKMEAHIATRAGVTFAKYKEMSGVELWIDAEDAVNSGFADKLVSVNVEMTPQFEFMDAQQRTPWSGTPNRILDPSQGQYNLDWRLYELPQKLFQ